jgi:hypothetical protein
MALSEREVVVAFTTNRAMGGLARVSRATGELVGVVQRRRLPSGLVMLDGTVAVAVNLHEDLEEGFFDEDAPMPEARSAIERIGIEHPNALDDIPVNGQILDLVGDPSRMWALVFSRAAQAMQVVAIHPASGSVGSPVDFSAIDLSGFSEPPAREFGPFRRRPLPPTANDSSGFR